MSELVRTLIWWIFIISLRSEWARNVEMNPDFITLINSFMNSGWACSDRRETMKICHIRVLESVQAWIPDVTFKFWCRMPRESVLRGSSAHKAMRSAQNLKVTLIEWLLKLMLLALHQVFRPYIWNPFSNLKIPVCLYQFPWKKELHRKSNCA